MDSNDDSTIETGSTCSMEEMAAKIESALRKNLQLDMNGRDEDESDEEVQDVTQLNGYQSVPDGCPLWKRALIEKKNKQLEEDAKESVIQDKMEEERWRDVPEWKKALILEKEKKKQEDGIPCAMERRRKDDEVGKLNSMPEWKRNLVMKKRPEIN